MFAGLNALIQIYKLRFMFPFNRTFHHYSEVMFKLVWQIQFTRKIIL